MLRTLYNWMMSFAGNRYAPLVLGIVAFAESSFFPIPPDPLFIAMALSARERVWSIAILCTLSSVTGGYLGYAIGYFVFESIGEKIITLYNLSEAFERFRSTLNEYGFWIVAGKGLTPIPYKVVTIASGVVSLDLTTFTTASFVARGFRFFSLAALLWWYGAPIKDFIEQYLGWVVLAGVAVLAGGFYLLVLL